MRKDLARAPSEFAPAVRQALAKSLLDTHQSDESIELVPEAPAFTPTHEDLRDGLLPYLRRILPEVLPSSPHTSAPSGAWPRRAPPDAYPRMYSVNDACWNRPGDANAPRARPGWPTWHHQQLLYQRRSPTRALPLQASKYGVVKIVPPAGAPASDPLA